MKNFQVALIIIYVLIDFGLSHLLFNEIIIN